MTSQASDPLEDTFPGSLYAAARPGIRIVKHSFRPLVSLFYDYSMTMDCDGNVRIGFGGENSKSSFR